MGVGIVSEWDFLHGLEGEELIDAMSCGMTYSDMAFIDEQEHKKEWEKLKELRDKGEITKEEFKKRKLSLFSK